MKRLIAIALLFVGTVAFAFTRQDVAPPTHMQMGRMEMMKECPLGSAELDVAVADTAGGITLTITTKTGDAAALRESVRAHLAMMNKMKEGMAGKAHYGHDVKE